MRILYINHYAGSPDHGMEYRPYYLAREWVRSGHAVRMLAASYSHVRWRQPGLDAQALKMPLAQIIDGIDYRWFPTPVYEGNGLGRLRNIASFLLRVAREARAIVREFRPDVVIASSTYPMDIWVARRLAKLAGATLVFEVHDLWPLSPIELSGMSPKHPFIRLCSAAEKTAYRDADVVVSMLPKVHQYMASRGLDLRKLHIVPNGIAPDEWSGTPAALNDSVACVISAARSAGRQVVGYAGSHGLPNALDTLVDAAALLRERAVEIVLVGDGHEKERLRQRVVDEGLAGRVHLLAPIPKSQIPAFLSAIDVAYIGWQRVPIYRFGIAPNKLMDYMMAACPVLHSIDAGNDPVAESGCGLTVPPADAAAVAAGLQRLLDMSPEQRRAMGERGRVHVLSHHVYPVLAHRFLNAACSAEPAI